MSRETLVELDQLSKHYNEFNRIENLNVCIPVGEVFALCGGNGAGKSTFIKLLTGIIKPTSGKIKVNGKSIDPTNIEYKKIFSYMPDEMAFPPQLTGLEALSFFAKLRGVPQSKVEETLKLVGLFNERNRYIKHYSKGMQQRLSLAQALLPDVKLVILDEPTNGLDPYWVYRFKEIMLEEKRKGKTILFTTHILTLVEEIADTAAFMEQGKLLYCEDVQKLMTQNGERVSLEKVFFDYQKSR